MHNGIANRQHTSWKLNVMQRKALAIDRAEFIVTDLEKHTSYEDEIKTSVEQKESCNLDADFNEYKYRNRSKVATSDITTSGLFHSFYFSDKLQNYSGAGQSLRYSIAFLPEVCSCFTTGDIIRNTQHVL